MTRKRAEKVAGAIVAAARKIAASAGEGETWTKLEVPVVEIAAVLKLRPMEVMQEIDQNIPTLWGKLPIGWRMTGEQGQTSLTLLRSV